MKKTILLLAFPLALTACGDGEITICDCVNFQYEIQEERKNSGGDQAKYNEIDEKYKDRADACKKLMEQGENDKEKYQELRQEIINCEQKISR